jgi:hypothetical protein
VCARTHTAPCFALPFLPRFQRQLRQGNPVFHPGTENKGIIYFAMETIYLCFSHNIALSHNQMSRLLARNGGVFVQCLRAGFLAQPCVDLRESLSRVRVCVGVRLHAPLPRPVSTSSLWPEGMSLSLGESVIFIFISRYRCPYCSQDRSFLEPSGCYWARSRMPRESCSSEQNHVAGYSLDMNYVSRTSIQLKSFSAFTLNTSGPCINGARKLSDNSQLIHGVAGRSPTFGYAVKCHKFLHTYSHWSVEVGQRGLLRLYIKPSSHHTEQEHPSRKCIIGLHFGMCGILSSQSETSIGRSVLSWGLP